MPINIGRAALGIALLVSPSIQAQVRPARVATPHAIRVVMDNAYAPYIFRSDQGKLQGILIDQWQAWERMTGIRVEIHAMDWGEALRRMRAGDFDVIDGIFETAERRKYFDFTPAYATVDASIFFRKDISGITDLASLRGFPVGVKRADQHVESLVANGVTTAIQFPNDDAIIEAAARHQINVFMVDEPSAVYLLNKLGIEREFRHSSPIFRDELKRAVRKGDRGLLRIVSEGFAAIGPGELAQINEKWFGKTIDRYWRYLAYAGYAAAVAALLIAGLAGWNRTLRKRILERTSALSESEQRFRQIAENIREVFWMSTVDVGAESHAVLYVSPAYESVWGRTRESLYRDPRSYIDAIHPEDRARAVDAVEQDRSRSSETEYRVVRPNGSIRWIRDRAFPIKDDSGRIYRVAGIAEDITERKLSEETSRQIAREIQALSAQNEEHLRLVINTIPTMVWSLRSDGTVDFVNQRWLEYTGLSFEEALKDANVIVHPDDLPKVLEDWLPDMAVGKPSQDEMRMRRADGEYRWFLVRTVPLRDERGNVVKWYGASTEFEDQKRAEEKLKATSEQLRALSARLQSVKEEESARIAREVHDEIGQALTALQMDVAWLGKRFQPSGASESENLAAKLGSMTSLIDQTIIAVQRIATDLRPGVLDELGLEATIEWYVREFEKRTGIACRFQSGVRTERVDSERATAVFRIVQEALTNVARHSGARRVKIQLTADKDRLEVEIEDDGLGIREDLLDVTHSLGLLGMRERASSLGGNLNIGRASPSGTLISLTIPA